MKYYFTSHALDRWKERFEDRIKITVIQALESADIISYESAKQIFNKKNHKNTTFLFNQEHKILFVCNVNKKYTRVVTIIRGKA